MSAIVAVTGATGFIGRNLIEKLVKDGRQVHALTRHARPDTKNVRWITGTLDDTDALNHLVSGAGAVVHCAGRVRGRSLQDFLDTNLDGTANIVRAALLQDPLPRFLLISSLAAREPDLSWYAQSKRQAEQSMIANAGSMQWTIYRPTAVYGPGDKELAPLLKATRLGILPVTGSRSARFGLIYVTDLVAAITAWLDSEKVIQGVYELDDGTPGGYDHNGVKAIASQVWNHPVYSLPVPVAMMQLVASVNLLLARLIGYSPMLTPGKVRELQHPDWVCDISHLSTLLGWKPVQRLQMTLKQTVLLNNQ